MVIRGRRVFAPTPLPSGKAEPCQPRGRTDLDHVGQVARPALPPLDDDQQAGPLGRADRVLSRAPADTGHGRHRIHRKEAGPSRLYLPRDDRQHGGLAGGEAGGYDARHRTR